MTLVKRAPRQRREGEWKKRRATQDQILMFSYRPSL